MLKTLSLLLVLTGQGVAAEDSEEAAYRRAIHARAARIVEPIGLQDADHAARVTDLIAGQYRALRDAHAERDARLEGLGPNADLQPANDAAHRAQVSLQRAFVARLAAELTPDQVEQVKNGMTYGVVPGTYQVYLELLPDLTEEQKRMIHANLLEAREYALHAGSSHEKHAWFGKYKGRINNALSKAGYDLKQAERDLAARKAAKNN